MSRLLQYNEKTKRDAFNVSLQTPEQDYLSNIQDFCKSAIVGNVVQGDVVHRVQFLDYDNDRLIQQIDGNLTYAIKFNYKSQSIGIPVIGDRILMKGSKSRETFGRMYYNGPIRGFCFSQNLSDIQAEDINVYEISNVKYINRGKCLVELVNVQDSFQQMQQLKNEDHVHIYFREQ